MAGMRPGRPPSQLLQRRLSQAHYNATEVQDMMAQFSMAFRPDANAALSLAYLQEQQRLAMQTGSIAPSDLVNHHATQDMDMLYADNPSYNAYAMPEGYNNATFGTLSWAAPINTGVQPVNHPSILRNESYSSSNSSEPGIKREDLSPVQPSQVFFDAAAYASSPDSQTGSDDTEETKPVVFSTEIDTLMRAIQSKTDAANQEDTPQSTRAPEASPNKPKKKYLCDVAGCGKAFYQKTHLEIHTRAHTGIKPFLCKEPSCGQRFSQLGNLKTHERRHTGERPYHCDICGKTFAQHGNVRAHKIVHTAAKPFTCKLDNCNKQFTQLGNLKSHQNKFHVDTIRRLKTRFENFKEGDVVDAWDKEMWEYFASLYKNCNKGIKGRGKDRRISLGQMAMHRRDSITSAVSMNGLASPSDRQQTSMSQAMY
ncbi:Asparagine-rich zinc finger protein AZF1 [Cercospora beticola]|uniref:Asparagine-rich zinc finger protein AZF1 n=1 Tax=Cercospora beticola TaxID=122368 RepID=A0A2G5HG74_CERBT|nr:Asparagine-rich zinc finger protein AZF1 [Cercospora beticola]PIA91586.1 Asparagine-rich zinc finger protein AZF1 [Cercospora beticola]WPB06231.1 hypothetical protein RHO25_010888 [Cercospora beticola]CAK1366115.1 unnamed protein product [Cercospora beticola]